jgi:hypothetical protein
MFSRPHLFALALLLGAASALPTHMSMPTEEWRESGHTLSEQSIARLEGEIENLDRQIEQRDLEASSVRIPEGALPKNELLNLEVDAELLHLPAVHRSHHRTHAKSKVEAVHTKLRNFERFMWPWEYVELIEAVAPGALQKVATQKAGEVLKVAGEVIKVGGSVISEVPAVKAIAFIAKPIIEDLTSYFGSIAKDLAVSGVGWDPRTLQASTDYVKPFKDMDKVKRIQDTYHGVEEDAYSLVKDKEAFKKNFKGSDQGLERDEVLPQGSCLSATLATEEQQRCLHLERRDDEHSHDLQLLNEVMTHAEQHIKQHGMENLDIADLEKKFRAKKFVQHSAESLNSADLELNSRDMQLWNEFVAHAEQHIEQHGMENLDIADLEKEFRESLNNADLERVTDYLKSLAEATWKKAKGMYSSVAEAFFKMSTSVKEMVNDLNDKKDHGLKDKSEAEREMVFRQVQDGFMAAKSDYAEKTHILSLEREELDELKMVAAMSAERRAEFELERKEKQEKLKTAGMTISKELIGKELGEMMKSMNKADKMAKEKAKITKQKDWAVCISIGVGFSSNVFVGFHMGGGFRVCVSKNGLDQVVLERSQLALEGFDHEQAWSTAVDRFLEKNSAGFSGSPRQLERRERYYNQEVSGFFFFGGGMTVGLPDISAGISLCVDYVMDDWHKSGGGAGWGMYNSFEIGPKMMGAFSAGIGFGFPVANLCKRNNKKTGKEADCWSDGYKFLGLLPGAAFFMSDLQSIGLVVSAGVGFAPTGLGIGWDSGLEYAWKVF